MPKVLSTPIGNLIRLRSNRSLRTSTASTVSSNSKGSGAGNGAIGSGLWGHQHGGSLHAFAEVSRSTPLIDSWQPKAALKQSCADEDAGGAVPAGNAPSGALPKTTNQGPRFAAPNVAPRSAADQIAIPTGAMHPTISTPPHSMESHLAHARPLQRSSSAADQEGHRQGLCRLTATNTTAGVHRPNP